MIFIPGDIPTWKNRQMATKNMKTFEFNHAVRKYLKEHWISEYSAKSKKNKETGEIIPPFVRMGVLPTFKHNGKIYDRGTSFPFEKLKEMTTDKPFPLVVGFHFVKKKRGRYDFNNLTQFVDLLIAGGVIPDDDMEHFFPAPLEINGKLVSYDKNNPGVWIKVF